MYAVIQTGGKQYKVTNDEVIFIEKLDAEANDTVTFDVVAVGTDDGIKVGTPLVEGAKVTGEVVKNGKGKKIRVCTYKPKKGEKRAKGHRQPYTQVKIRLCRRGQRYCMCGNQFCRIYDCKHCHRDFAY